MIKRIVFLTITTLSLAACGDDVGSKAWCSHMEETPKTQWSSDNAMDYAKHCLMGNEVGSKTWCHGMKDKPKGEWTANEATSYAKHCIL